MSADTAIPLYLFARAPVPGQVKTRMQPALTPETSARLAETMLRQSVARVVEYWPGRTVIAATPSDRHPVFQSLVRGHGVTTVDQQGADLGQRMGHALRSGIAECGSAVVMGCDVPHFDSGILQKCHNTLVKGLDVVGPTVDGGFYLLGLQHFEEALFSGITWGSDTVLTHLFRNARKLGMDFNEMDTLRDVDNQDDLLWLAGLDSEYRNFVT